MSAGLLGLVLSAAVLHAIWNSLVKVSADRVAVLGLISAGHVVLGLVLATAAPIPWIASWPYIAASTIIHFGYYALLNRSYKLGDLSVMYPIARGLAPVLVTLGAAVTAGEVLPPRVLVGILVVSGGILGVSGVLRGQVDRKSIATAAGNGVMIAAYSLVDGLGVRASGAPLGYIAWLFVFEIFVVIFVFVGPSHRIGRVPRHLVMIGTAGGFISASAYGMVIFAKAFAPLGVVSTLRETSVLFAALIGIVFLGERPWRARLLAVGVVVSGIVVIATA